MYCQLCYLVQFSCVSVVSNSIVSDSVTRWIAAHQASLSTTNSWSLLKLMSIESVMLSNHLILCPPDFNLSQHQGLFPMSRLFTSGGPSFRASASASVLSVNIHDLFPLQLIFSPRDSQESFLAPEF